MEILCGGCGRQVEVEEDLAGTAYQCPHCGRMVHVPSLTEDEAGGDDESLLARLDAEDDLADEFLTKARLALKKKLLVVCGSCSERLTVEQRLAGKVARCPACGDQIRIPAAIDEEPLEPEELMTNGAGTGRTLDAGEPLADRPAQPPPAAEEPAAAPPAEPSAARARPFRPFRAVRPPPVRKASPAVLVTALLLVALATGLGGLFVGYQLGDRGPEGAGPDEAANSTPPLKPERPPEVARVPEPPTSVTRTAPTLPVGPASTEPTRPKATAGLKTLRAQLTVLAGAGFVPAPMGRQFLEVKVQIAAGAEPVTIDTAAGEVVVEIKAGQFASIGTPASGSLLPAAARAGKMTVPPTATRIETFLFVVPPSVSAGTLRIAGLGQAPLPAIERFPPPPPAALAGTYAEAARRLKLSFDDPIMEQVRAAGEHKLVITADGERFKLAAPPTGLTGNSIFQGRGSYTTVLTHRGKALPCHLRLLPGGKRLVLYLAEKPYHQVIYDKQ